jgi:LysM repeat protein
MVEISEGSDGTQWGIGQDARVYKKEGGSWKQNPSGDAAHIVVLDANNVYVSNSNGEVYKLKGSAYNSEWEKDQDARNVVSLKRSPDGTTIEVTNEQGDLYQLENGKWKLLFSERHPEANLKYIVKAGDTLSQIAKAQNTTVEALMAVNPEITDPDRIQAGQVLFLPSTAEDYGISDVADGADESRSYTVKKGDHLLKIVREQYGEHLPPTSHNEIVDLIVRHNNLPSRDRIYPGQVLKLPGVSI